MQRRPLSQAKCGERCRGRSKAEAERTKYKARLWRAARLTCRKPYPSKLKWMKEIKIDSRYISFHTALYIRSQYNIYSRPKRIIGKNPTCGRCKTEMVNPAMISPMRLVFKSYLGSHRKTGTRLKTKSVALFLSQ